MCNFTIMEPKTDKWAADNADWSQINADLLKTGLSLVILNVTLSPTRKSEVK
jgi:hypothetical protein